jgi:GABA(A) receptor-associated protein
MDALTLAPNDFERLQSKFPNSIFAFVSQGPRSELPPLDKHKYIVPKDLTVGQFLFVLRRRMKLPPEKALFVFIDNNLPVSSQTMGELYAQHKSRDGVIRLVCTSESVFGI